MGVQEEYSTALTLEQVTSLRHYLSDQPLQVTLLFEDRPSKVKKNLKVTKYVLITIKSLPNVKKI